MGSMGTRHGQRRIGSRNPPRRWVSNDKKECSEGKGEVHFTLPDWEVVCLLL